MDGGGGGEERERETGRGGCRGTIFPARRSRPLHTPGPHTDDLVPTKEEDDAEEAIVESKAEEEEEEAMEESHGNAPFPPPSYHPEVGNPAGAETTLSLPARPPDTPLTLLSLLSPPSPFFFLLLLSPMIVEEVEEVVGITDRSLFPLLCGSSAVVVMAVEKSIGASPAATNVGEECRKLRSTA